MSSRTRIQLDNVRKHYGSMFVLQHTQHIHLLSYGSRSERSDIIRRSTARRMSNGPTERPRLVPHERQSQTAHGFGISGRPRARQIIVRALPHGRPSWRHGAERIEEHHPHPGLLRYQATGRLQSVRFNMVLFASVLL